MYVILTQIECAIYSVCIMHSKIIPAYNSIWLCNIVNWSHGQWMGEQVTKSDNQGLPIKFVLQNVPSAYKRWHRQTFSHPYFLSLSAVWQNGPINADQVCSINVYWLLLLSWCLLFLQYLPSAPQTLSALIIKYSLWRYWKIQAHLFICTTSKSMTTRTKHNHQLLSLCPIYIYI